VKRNNKRFGSVLILQKELCEEQGLFESRILDILLERILDAGTRQLPPVCAAIGGILGQEVIKAMS
jgi:ubiquitin-like 1-activating enzyme E1 A